MDIFKGVVARLLASNSGATSIEYALIATLISIAIIGGATAVGVALQSDFQDVADKVQAAGS